MQHRSVRHGTRTTHYWITGRTGAPWLVACHGGALDHSGFLPLAQRLAERYRVLLWDLPGHGLSQPMPQPFTLDACVEALAAVLDDAGVERATLLGFSFGGVVAQLYAWRHPGREQGLVHYACLLPLLMKLPIPGSLISLLVWASAGWRSWAANKATFARLCTRRPEPRAAIERTMDALGRANYLAMLRAMYRVPPPQPAFRLTGPVMFLAGDADPARRHYPSMMRALRSAYPDAVVETVPDAGHCAHLDNPAAFDAAVEGFLARAWPGPGR